MNVIELAYAAFCTERFPMPNEGQVTQLENRIGVRFPDTYRHFVLHFNGGYFNEPRIVPPRDDCPDDLLTFLHGIGASHPDAELGSEGDLAIFDDNDPVQVVPVGDTIMGNLIILCLQHHMRGAIVLKEAFSDNVFVLGKDIEQFFGLLHEPPDDY